ncbi:hypothetical protein TIFTF001_042535 [Ficus carica]|uniref:Uncharacterized protein n=1 Tax=Ficus carica TaxID=3494 RepID=A0AA87ZR29_FICCA|nr:hypothetical protein TIFTF001_042535 [Ficus carica]
MHVAIVMPGNYWWARLMSHGRGGGFRFGGKSPVTDTEGGGEVSFVNWGSRSSMC